MKKYLVTLLEHVRWTYEVEASHEDEAVDIACGMENSKAERNGQYNGYEIELIEDGVDEQQMRKDFSEFLEGLTHHRFTFEKLEELIKEYAAKVGATIVGFCHDLESGSIDYDFGFSIEDHPIAGDFDIYYLKMDEERAEALGDTSRIYITEIACDFN